MPIKQTDTCRHKAETTIQKTTIYIYTKHTHRQASTLVSMHAYTKPWIQIKAHIRMQADRQTDALSQAETPPPLTSFIMMHLDFCSISHVFFV